MGFCLVLRPLSSPALVTHAARLAGEEVGAPNENKSFSLDLDSHYLNIGKTTSN